jgi:hypothetical protein
MLTVNPDQYIYPPRPEQAIPKDQAEIYYTMGWRPQLKYNDSRALIKHVSGQITLWNRHGERFRTYHTPDWLLDQITQTIKTLGLDPAGYHLLDGGLLDQKHSAIKDTLVIWDILVRDGQQLLGTTYLDRYNMLVAKDQQPWYYKQFIFGKKITDNIFVADLYYGVDHQMLWDMVAEVNAPFTVGNEVKPLIEGIVIKNPHAQLEMGYKEKNNTDWIVKSRVKTGRHRF